jgi:hypothetical protein
MTKETAPLFDRLFGAGNPRDLIDWESRDGYYVAECRISTADVPGLIDLVRKWSDPGWPPEDGTLVNRDNAELLPVMAWRTLADLKAEAAVQPLIDILSALEDGNDDWVLEELPHVFGKIGEASIEPLTRVATDDGNQDLIGSIAVRGLRCVVKYHPHTRDRIVALLTEMMAKASPGHVQFSTTVLSELVDLHAVEAAEPIERAFAANVLDAGMLGDWEAVRRKLGVQGLGLKMPDHPYNSVELFRHKMGVGIFSDRPIFGFGEIDSDAQEAYYQRTHETFSKSSEAKQALERYGNLGWFQTLVEYGLNYLGETVDQMTPGSLQEFVFGYLPRKVSTDADTAPEIVGELTLFWQFLDRVYKLPAAKALVEWLQAPDLVARLKDKLSDPANFGMAKSLFMLGKSTGHDMTSQAGLEQFKIAYNRLLASTPPARPPAPKQRVGRNEPCPCGSGKKYKKCCGDPRQMR